jgi:hypothetical protein
MFFPEVHFILRSWRIFRATGKVRWGAAWEGDEPYLKLPQIEYQQPRLSGNSGEH